MEQWLFGAVIAVLAAGLLVFAWFQYGRQPDAAVEQPAAPPSTAPEPGISPGSPTAADTAPALPAEPLPALADSDVYASRELGRLFGDGLAPMLAHEALIEKFVTTIDNLPRDKLSERLRPLGRLPGEFAVLETAGGDRYTVAPDNERRYDTLVTLFTSTPTDDLLAYYRRFYPLFQEAYVGLGYPDGEFHARLGEVIDHLLATPEPEQAPALVRPNVLYQYADRDLEQLSSGQKALLRLSPAQRGALRDKLRVLRAALGATPPH